MGTTSCQNDANVCRATACRGRPGSMESVFYMGPLMAGHISGIDQAVKKFAVKGV